MKRIVIFSLVYYPRFVGGAEVALKEITDRLGEEYEFDLVTLRKQAPAFERIGKVNVYRVGWEWEKGNTRSSRIFPIAKLLYPILAAQKALSLHAKKPYDLVWGMMAAYAGFAALFFKLARPKVPYLLTLQEGDPIPYIKRRAFLVYPLFKMIFTRADYIQAISTYLAAFGRDMGFTGSLEVVPNGVDLSRFTVTPHTIHSDGKVFLVTTSRLVTKNAVDDVIRTLPLLPETVEFRVYGSGRDEDMLKRLAHELGISNRVHFLGFLDHADLPKALAESHIFIRPSRSEGMGISFIEAMAAGLPVIATQEGGIADFLYDAKRNPESETTGYAVDTDSPEQIAEAVRDILAHPEKAHMVAEAAARMVQERYDWNRVAAGMGTIFKKMVQ